MPEPTPQIVQLPAQRAAVIHAEAAQSELAEVFARIFPAVDAALNEQGVSDRGHVIAVYHGMDAEQMELSGGIEIGDDVELAPDDEVVLLEIAAGEAIKADHIGPYEELGATHEAVWAFAQQAGREPRSGPIERYITDPGAEPDPSKWHTEILLPAAIGRTA